MRKLYISTIRPHLDYCSQLWAPKEGPLLDKMGRILYNYTKLIPEIRNLPYEELLKRMNLTSIQTRFDRYKCIYTRKSILGIVPNNGLELKSGMQDSNGPMIKMKTKKDMSKLRSDSFEVRGVDIFNALPKDLRDMETSAEIFKSHLDTFLELIPDRPRIGNGSNI